MKSICPSSCFESLDLETLPESGPKTRPGLFPRAAASSRGVRASVALPRIPAAIEFTRDYFRSLRAAEMATWELTGGDYLRSTFTSRARE